MDRILVEPVEPDQITAAGIILPETAKEKPQKGQVLAVGPGRRDQTGARIPMDVGEGDRILFARYAGTEVKVSDQKLLILKESDVLAIIQD